jgi:hypothetical protein
MSSRDFAIELINQMPEYKVGYAIAYLQGLTADDLADDLYCADLLTAYQDSTDKGDFVSLDEALKMCGVDINAVQN